MILRLKEESLVRALGLITLVILLNAAASLAQTESSPVATGKGDGTAVTFVYQSDIKGKIEECG